MSELPYFLSPQDETDTFCTCPKCYLIGHHSVEQYEANFKLAGVLTVNERRELVNDGLVDVTPFGMVHGATYVRRTCCFCGHEWSTPV